MLTKPYEAKLRETYTNAYERIKTKTFDDVQRSSWLMSNKFSLGCVRMRYVNSSVCDEALRQGIEAVVGESALSVKS